MGPPAPDVLVPAATLDQIIAAVNGNAQRVQTYQTNNASISIPGALGIPTLRGNIAAMRPRRLRLQASTAITGPEVDLGSNDELFWFWVRRNEPPQVYFARHAQAPGTAAAQLMPLDPQWLLDALGMAEFKPTDRHEGPLPIDKNRVEIKSYIQSTSGPLVKRTVVDANKAWVLEQHLYDGAGRLLASAVAKSHRYYPETGASLPQTIEVKVPPAELAMTIDVGTVELNRLADNPQLWTLPVIQGSPAVDLGAQPPLDPGGGAPTLGAQIYGANWYDAPPAAGVPLPIGGGPVAPPPASIAVAGPLPAAAPPHNAGPAPQFLPPHGVPNPSGSAGGDLMTQEPQPVAALNAQRLPAGGVATTTVTR
jgi:hypothetical protein